MRIHIERKDEKTSRIRSVPADSWRGLTEGVTEIAREMIREWFRTAGTVRFEEQDEKEVNARAHASLRANRGMHVRRHGGTEATRMAGHKRKTHEPGLAGLRTR